MRIATWNLHSDEPLHQEPSNSSLATACSEFILSSLPGFRHKGVDRHGFCCFSTN